MTSVNLPVLPEPYATPSATNFATVVGWPDGLTPKAPVGFSVNRWARGLDYPRWFHLLPNGDVLVAEARSVLLPVHDRRSPEVEGSIRARGLGTSANRITLLRDADGDGIAEFRTIFLDGLDRPFGMALLGDRLYVANTGGVLVYPYRPGQTRLESPGEKILDLPVGGYNNHWTRNIVVGPGGRKLYVTVGSASNVGEYGMAEEERRAAILETDPDGGNERLFASGLRNPVDPRLAGRRPDLVAKSLAPDFALGSHTASLGLLFYRGASFAERFRGGAFIGQHGSWNRAELSGYNVTFVPFAGGRPAGAMEDFLTGFICADDPNKVYGRPCGLAVLGDGSLLVADDAADVIWRVQAT